MAYALRYYKELIHEDGSAHRLEIHKKDSTAEAVEIGAVIQGLALEIQGSQGDVDSPIVKTSLSMTFVDAGDIEDGRKNGFWQEFYTPDALLWKVILKARTATETSFRTIWGGYVTPDSFSESLVYRGSVNIIARDNIGHMQDFPFDAVGDADGLISLRNLVEAGWEKIQSPMVLDWRGETESNMWLMCDGVPAPDTLMNVSQFEGMDWYKAIETALASYGIVMRYVGDNIVNMSSLRSMPLQGREVYDNLSQITPVFVAGAQRELVPAVRRIEESVDYDIQEEQCDPIESSDFTGDIEYYNIQGNSAEKEGIAWAVTKKESGYGWCAPEYSMFFNPRAYTFFNDNDADAKYMWLCANIYEINSLFSLRYAECSRFIYNASNVVFNVKFGSPYAFTIGGFLNTGNDFLKRCVLSVKIVKDDVTYYLDENGEWGEVKSKFSVDIQGDMLNLPIDFGTLAGSLLLCVQIQHLFTDRETYARYVPVYSTTISQGLPVLEKNTVNTAYNAENNVILSRTPEIGPAYNTVALPGLIKNGIFYRSEGVILPARAWGWSGSTPQQMAVYNHLQLLCYYAKPNNLISGTIVNGDLTSGRAIYLWHGKEHLLVSGRYNLLNGMIEGAMLREFTRYEAMWGEVSETAFPDTEQDSTTNVEGGASSGGSSSTYTNTTTVNIGSGGGGGASYLNDLLDVNTDSVTVQSVLYYNGTEWVGRSLSTILNGYAKSADLMTLSNLLASMWSIDADGNLVTDKQVIIKNNLVVHGDQTAGGEGSASVGITGITLNGTTYRDTDGDGIIDLGEITGGGGTITEITSAMIISALGYTPYDASNPNSYITVAAVPTTVSAFTNDSGYITASALGGYATQSWVEGKGYITASALSGYITESAVNSKLASYQPISTAINTSNIGSQKVAGFATARSIWGQSFDGTGDVSGNLTLANNTPIDVTLVSGTAATAFYLSSTNVLQIGYGTALVGADTIISGENLQLRYSTSRKVGLILNSSGNVLIGTTTDSGSKLFVNGVTRASAFRSTNIGIECDTDGNTTGYGSEINRFGSNLYLQGRGGNLYLSHSEGTTFIRGIASITGAVTMASTLSVGGASTFNGDVRINGNLIVTGDISA